MFSLYGFVRAREISMATRALLSSEMLLVAVCLIVLAGCGTNNNGTQICPLNSNAGTSVCNCGTSLACRAPAYVYANGIDGNIYTFPVDLNTGGLGTPTSITGVSNSLGMAALNNQFLYVSNPAATAGGTSSINAWSINSGTGTLTSIAGSPFPLGPISLSLGLSTDNTTQTLYVADAAKIDVLKADVNGALTEIAGSPFPTFSGLFLATDSQNRYLFATNDFPPAGVEAFTINSSTGALTLVPGAPFAIGGGVGSALQVGIAVDPTGSFVYTVLESTNQVAAFSISSPSGMLTPVPGSPFVCGKTPIAVVAVGHFLYVSNAGDGTLSGYSIDSSSGVLTPLASSPFAIRTGAMTIDPSGSFLFTSGAGGMLTFSINSTSGTLTQVGSLIPFAGATALAYVQ